MEEAQYDIPWELKTRALCALRARPHSTNDHGTNCIGLVKVSPSMAGQTSKLSSDSERGPAKQSSSTPSPQDHKRVRSACLPVTSLNNGQSRSQHNRHNYPQVGHQIHQSQQHPPDPQTSFKAFPAMNEDPPHSTKLNETPVAIRRHNLHFDEATMVHEQMDRVEAEKCLVGRQIGDYLLRRRPDGNLAVSLRATDTIMHIKLERRKHSTWVLGEGPSFKSIGSVLRFYSKTELPIRGAEHVQLRSPLLTGVSP